MKRLISTKGMTELEWLKQRRRGIGGSDASVILGENPYRSVIELWLDKTNQVPVKKAENNFTHFGHILEPVIRKEFQKQTGKKVVVRNCIFQSEAYPFMLADIDALVYEPDGSKAILEIKTAIEYKKGEWENGKIPSAYYSQVQHYMSVCGLYHAYICCLVGGNSLYTYRIERDEAFIAELVEKETEFWNHVLDMTMPEVDGSEATKKCLDQMYAVGELDEVALPDEAAGIAEQYVEINEQLKTLNKEKTLLGNQLKVLMKEHEIGIVGEHKISWKTYSKENVDKERLREHLGEKFEEFVTDSPYRRLSVA